MEDTIKSQPARQTTDLRTTAIDRVVTYETTYNVTNGYSEDRPIVRP